MSVFLSTQTENDAAALELAIDRERIDFAWLLELQFASGTVYVSNWNHDIEVAGHEWRGLGDLVGMSEIGGQDGLAPYREYQLGLPRSLTGYSDGKIPALLGNEEEYVNRPARLWLQIFDPDHLDTHGRRVPLGVPFAMDYSVMSKVSATYSIQGATLKLQVEGGLFSEGFPVEAYNESTSQQYLYPGDNGMNYVEEAANTVIKMFDA
jgi:hypothetical protein